MTLSTSAQSALPSPPVAFFPGEVEVFRPRPERSTFEWMKRNLRLVVGQKRGQLWDPEYLPYARGILDAIDKPSVREVLIAAGSQSGKTTLAYGYLLAARARGRGSSGVSMPDEKAAERIFEGRLHLHVRSSLVLRRLVSEQQHALQKAEIKWRDGACTYGIWAGSESSRSSVTLEDLVIDEEDAYLDKAAVGVTMERLTDHPHSSKCIRISKVRGMAGESTIWRDMHARADVVHRYMAVCPGCGHAQHMRFEQIRVDKHERDPARIRRKLLARYICEQCSLPWSDVMRDRALARGFWQADRSCDRPVVVGFRLRAMEFPRVSLSTILAEWFEAQGDPDKLRNFDNNRLSKEHKAIVQETTEEQLLKLVDTSVQPLVVPARALAVTLAVDTQKQGFYYSIWAHGLDPVEDWVIDYGTLPGMEALEAMVFELTLKREGSEEQLGVWRAAVDTGGTKHEGEDASRTQQVYEWLLRQPPGVVFGTKGMSRATAGSYVRFMDTIKLANGRKVPGVGRAYMVDADYFKRLLMARLDLEAPEPIRLHEHVERDYVRHFLAERLVRDKKGREVWEQVSRANHYLDCAVLHLAMRHPQWTPPLHVLAWGKSGAARKPGERKQKRRMW